MLRSSKYSSVIGIGWGLTGEMSRGLIECWVNAGGSEIPKGLLLTPTSLKFLIKVLKYFTFFVIVIYWGFEVDGGLLRWGEKSLSD